MPSTLSIILSATFRTARREACSSANGIAFSKLWLMSKYTKLGIASMAPVEIKVSSSCARHTWRSACQAAAGSFSACASRSTSPTTTSAQSARPTYVHVSDVSWIASLSHPTMAAGSTPSKVSRWICLHAVRGIACSPGNSAYSGSMLGGCVMHTDVARLSTLCRYVYMRSGFGASFALHHDATEWIDSWMDARLYVSLGRTAAPAPAPATLGCLSDLCAEHLTSRGPTLRPSASHRTSKYDR